MFLKGVEMAFKHSSIQAFKHSSIQAFKHSSNATIIFVKTHLKIPLFSFFLIPLTNFLENLIQ
ncbi:hypothetical protein HPSA20_1047 [Helicobacter pylori SouthAfrica20]|uniref:Uncharacterized protein n=1 Tax=Helicobacter pylori SouthAfrica20 TaxID=1352356 RepID=T1UA59_HELPX|nr:hypothetical protein HPSA20_1047 [Helicobacter pylori SouthAfrica20]